MIKSEALRDSIASLEVDGVTIDKDAKRIFPSYRAQNSDGDTVIDSGYTLDGAEYDSAEYAVDQAVTEAAKGLKAGEVVDVFGIIERVMYAGAVRRLGLDI